MLLAQVYYRGTCIGKWSHWMRRQDVIGVIEPSDTIHGAVMLRVLHCFRVTFLDLVTPAATRHHVSAKIKLMTRNTTEVHVGLILIVTCHGYRESRSSSGFHGKMCFCGRRDCSAREAPSVECKITTLLV